MSRSDNADSVDRDTYDLPMAGDYRDFPADVDPQRVEEAGKALDHLINTVENHALAEYFLQQAERVHFVHSPVVVICPASRQLHVYGPFQNLEEADHWLDAIHFEVLSAFSGNFCKGEVDYDMHGVVGMEVPSGDSSGG